MRGIQTVLNNLDWMGLVSLLLSAVGVLLCMTVHELCHGLTACRLGDPTAKRMGRLSLNPIKHIDILGFAMLLFVGVGWAKPVPVDMRYFKRPKRDMALTALAGPVSNMVLSFLLLALYSGLVRILPGGPAAYFLLNFLSRTAVMSIGLGLFNLLPISPLDGSKILFSLFPDKVYYTILRYERYVMIPLMILMFVGVFDGLLDFCINGVLGVMLRMVGLT
ncbi:site-2 protease family protein [Pseudoflavonifractor phocaeensis]|uniref:site-2 protease family protein n=1 Tax=Pseudoflavonifractor phocaeensis TaxID=1870988 RepID=UPI00210D55E3|nr:site-2 protease family protein [Pseudoflavonifractor phocaeensis]MCQ4864291.1 site-2 protease family protein [Pseudoflavonifractor phocaeensis]